MSFLKYLGGFYGVPEIMRNCYCIASVGFVSSASLNCEKDYTNPLKCNPYFNKYSKRISDLRRTCPEEMLTRLKGAFDKDPRSVNNAVHIKKSDIHLSQTKQVSTLKDVFELEFLQESTTKEIADMWLKHHHQSKNCIADVISNDVYCLMQERSLLYPTFLLPLPREQGYEFILSQFSNSEVHLTPLISYQKFKENAPECLALAHFTDLQDQRGIVLMKGEFNRDIINCAEAMCLANQLQQYYGVEHRERLRLLERFHNSPSDFQYMDLIVELEKLAV